ncbi:serine/threonine-protein kinase [Actinokineospora auranticolor]|uniref:non-specific serine/threonine protein kinase n=1 Tax=Actinokineospora auranticolor TaxID=155976 RepID=A0A2S6GZH8_9PSEU|nr:serine/threonine-protein kinase [Actinokineospora auranticolor]PPK70571.1 serine/threonine-protein kinase [Actinokineospora auranticolor]
MSEDLTGRRLGHYRIDGVLGKGGMSVMYRATDIRLGRKVALKVIAEHLTEDPEFRERFVDEARNTSAIDHANVVPLYDFGETDGLLYIAMRLVDGSDMASLIKDGPLAPQRALNLLGQVAEALDNLHERGLVHLDVKPANVLVTTRESATEHIYVADFGLTRRGATGHRTRGGDFLGSPTYAAPEHLRGEPVDGRTDAYSLACVLFACLAGRPPFQGQVAEVIQGHLNREPPTLTDFVALPPAINDVVRRGMAKSQAQRYSSCRELVAAARRALAGAQQRPQQQRNPNATLVERPHFPPSGPQPIQPEPMRLRPPTPVGTNTYDPFDAVITRKKGKKRWLAPVIAGAVAVAAVVTAVILFAGGGGSGGDSPETSTTPTPPIKVGPEGTSDRPTTRPSRPTSTTPSRPTTRRTLPPITIVPPP